MNPRLVGVAEDEHVAVGAGGDPLERAGGLVFEEVLVDLARRPVQEPHAVLAYALAFQIEVLLDRGRPDEAATVLAASGMPKTAPPLLPYLVLQQNRGRLRIRLGDIGPGEADMHAAAEGSLLPFGVATLIWVAYTAVLVGAAALLTSRRDI